MGAVFTERCELRKGLAVLDAQERQLNWKIRSKENYIRRLESLGVEPEKRIRWVPQAIPAVLVWTHQLVQEAHSVVRAHL